MPFACTSTSSLLVFALAMILAFENRTFADQQLPADLYVFGYADQVSYTVGDSVSLHLSSNAKSADIEIQRLGASAESVWQKADVAVNEHAIPDRASSDGCRWPSAIDLTVPADWKSGYYQATLRVKQAAAEGKPEPTASGSLFFVVREANPGSTSKILLQLSTNTYNAYNNWGGHSLYSYHDRDAIQGHRVSFDRPCGGLFNNWENQFIQWAEKTGYTMEYAANSDLEFHPEILASYRLVLSVGHDEYWSSPMRDHLEKFIVDGGNVAFFSGNTCCWQVRSEDAGRALTCWKQGYVFDPLYRTGDPKLLSTLWSHHLVGRPENQLTGVGFLWGGYHKSHGQFMDGSGAYTIHRPDHWIFEGTGLKRGDALGAANTIVGYECDGCELKWVDGLPEPTHSDGTPEGFTVLGTAPARWHPGDCLWYDRFPKDRIGNAVMGLYTRGGTVFTCGSTDWSHGLHGNDPAVTQITKNILDRLSQ